MTIRRPTSADRRLADWIHKLPVGEYRIDVTDGMEQNPTGERYCHLARLKHEGGLTIDRLDKLIEIYPVRGTREKQRKQKYAAASFPP